MKHTLFIVFSLLFVKQINSFCQQSALYITYPMNPLSLNPAYAGSSGVASVSVLVRKQTLIVQGPGSSQYLSYNTPLAKNRGGFGLQAFNSNFGSNGGGTVGMFLSGAYKFNISDSISVSFGAQSGFSQVPEFNTGATALKWNSGAGIYLRTINGYFGVSMPAITKTKYLYSATQSYEFPRPMFATAGYVFKMNEKWDLKIGAVARKIEANTDIDFNAVVWYNKVVGIGIWKNNTGSENNNKALIFSAETQVSNKFRLGFSFDAKGSERNGVILVGQNPATGNPTKLGLYNLMLRYDFDNLTGKIDRFRFF